MWKRSNDLVLTVIQDNNNHSITINNISSSLAHILGYQALEIINSSLFTILSPLSREYVAESIDFKYNDLGILFSKLTKITLINRHNDLINMVIKGYLINKTNNKVEFQLLLETQEVNKHLLLLKTNIQTIKKQCQLLVGVNKEIITLTYILQATINYIYTVKPKQDSIFVILEIMNALEMLIHGNSDLMNNIITTISKNIRENDVVLKLNENQIALILMETETTSLEKVIGRLIKVIVKNLGPELKAVFNVGCSFIKEDESPDKIIQKCLRSVRKSSFYGGNKLIIHNYYENKTDNLNFNS